MLNMLNLKIEKETIGGSILIVEDDRGVRGMIHATLARFGYHCTMAADAGAARATLAHRRFDLMLCDIRMPGESGLDLVEAIRGVYPEMAIIMVTGIDDMAMARRAIAMDVHGYVVKQAGIGQILISVANALRRRQLELEARAVHQNLERLVQDRTTELSAANAALHLREKELESRNRELEELNCALCVLLKKRDEDRAAIEESVMINIKKIAQPSLQRIKAATRLSKSQVAEIDSLSVNLDRLVSSFAKQLTSITIGLTPTELQVADLIHHGKSTKEIAGVLNLSDNTIKTHRYKIRTKLGLKNNKQNLRAYLDTFRN